MPTRTGSTSASSPDGTVSGSSGGPSPEVIQFIQPGELRLARQRCLRRALLFVVACGSWLVIGRAALGLTPLLGWLFFSTISAGIEWRRVLVNLRTPGAAAAAEAGAQELDDWAMRHDERLARRPSTVTPTLVAVISAIWLLQMLTGDIAGAVGAAGLIKPAARAGQWWRLLTSSYLHGSLLHVVANMSALLSLGRVMEAYQPRGRVLVVYVCAVIGGGLASLVLAPHSSSVGASGGILGLVGYLLVLTWRAPGDVPPGLRTGLLATLGATACIGLFGFRFIDNAAHAGGALTGALIGLLLVPITKVATPPDSRRERVLAWSAGAVLLVGAIFTATRVIQATAGTRHNTVAPVVEPGTTPIRGIAATVRLTGPSEGLLVVTNLRDVPLEAWVIERYRNVGDVTPVETLRIDACCLPQLAGAGPIAPHASRSFKFNRYPDSKALVANVRVVLFSDLVFEGSPKERDHILKVREETAADVAFWIDSIHAALALPSERIADYLQGRLDGRAREAQAAHRSFHDGLSDVIRTARTHPDQFPAAARSQLAALDDERAALLRRR